MNTSRRNLFSQSLSVGVALFLVLSCRLAVAQQAGSGGEAVRFFQDEQVMVGSAAVRVKRGHLVHSGSVYARRATGSVAGDFAAALDELEEFLPVKAAASELTVTLVKLHVCVAPDVFSGTTMAEISEVVDKRWADDNAPAVTVVKAAGGGDVVLDGVWHVAPKQLGDGPDAAERWAAVFDENFPSFTGVASPARDILHVSGKAASGELAEATTGTMEQIFAVLKELGAEALDVVQVKAFIQPMDQLEVVERSIAASFDTEDLPPIVFVQWTSPSRATEIEVIAMAPEKAENSMSTSYFTPTGEKASPVYSRVCRVHGDEVIFIGGIAGIKADSGEAEVITLYDGLKRIAAASGTDLKHLVKATYYVSEGEGSAALNVLRPNYYDPVRPPAASKVSVPGVGVAGRSLLIDMIAAPVE